MKNSVEATIDEFLQQGIQGRAAQELRSGGMETLPSIIERGLKAVGPDFSRIQMLLGHVRGSGVSEHLGQLIGMSGRDARQLKSAALTALGNRPDEHAFDVLVDLLNHSTRGGLAVQPLGELGDERAVQPLLTMMRELVPSWDADMAATIKRLRASDYEFDFELVGSLIEALAKLGVHNGGCRFFEAVLTSKNSTVDDRESAANSLRIVVGPTAVETLVGALSSERSPDARFQIVESLFLYGTPRVVEVLAAARKDSVQYVRGRIERRLGEIGAPGQATDACLRNGEPIDFVDLVSSYEDDVLLRQEIMERLGQPLFGRDGGDAPSRGEVQTRVDAWIATKSEQFAAGRHYRWGHAVDAFLRPT